MVSDGTPREPGSTVAAVRIILCPPGITTTRATLRNDAATDIRDIRIKRDSHVLREGAPRPHSSRVAFAPLLGAHGAAGRGGGHLRGL